MDIHVYKLNNLFFFKIDCMVINVSDEIMLYPKSGVIQYESVSKIIIGPITKPNFTKW